MTAGQSVTDPRTGIVTPQSYASNLVGLEQGAVGDGTLKSFTFVLAQKPIKSQSLAITVESDSITRGVDIGPDVNGIGQIYGIGVSGTVNYISGSVTVNFYIAPANGKKIFSAYQFNYELAADLPQIDSFYDSKSITAQVFALRGSVGMLQSYGMRKLCAA